MASRVRPCGHLAPRAVPWFPAPESIAKLAPLTPILMDAAQEYDAIGEGELTTAVEWVQWIDAEARKAGGDMAFRTIVTGTRAERSA